MAEQKKSAETKLVEELRKSEGSESFVSTTLKTDERVIARITDGIYRQPASALRELISNAYDADASRVVIKTDAPRFDRISIEDNGLGMTPEVIAHLLFHIGGSPKRSQSGAQLGVTAHNDPLRSPGGRRLIGKIGIGLFSVSQLTHSFQIITKAKGDHYRTVATVILRQYTDDEVASESTEKGEFESGKVNIWREKAKDTSSHGTTIILTNIRPQARDTLRSRDIWSAVEQNESNVQAGERQTIEPPRFHVGRVDAASGDLLKKTAGKYDSLPWEQTDTPVEAFKKLEKAVWDEAARTNPNPRLDRIFDYYLRMIWQLSLAVPLPYVKGHLFDLRLSNVAHVFQLSNDPKGSAIPLDLTKNQQLRSYLSLVDPAESIGKFDVLFDDVQLFRPIRFTELPTTSHALKKPLVFLGKCHEEFPKIARELSGGTLDFEAYLLWTPKVVPTEHQGSLIRIHGSSGTLFDPTFMRYQISEQTRLRQIVCEIFVRQGLDSALNIDRESFNAAHPHAVYITKWLHSALRQLATAQKKLASEVRGHARDESKTEAISEIRKVVRDVWAHENDDSASNPPAIELASSGKKPPSSESDTYYFSRSAIIPQPPESRTTRARARIVILEEKLKAIGQVLASFGLLDSLSKKKQESLLKAIYQILNEPEE
jgi:Histidine kinase-, DNA gyrase B-, and HSP90-like ATPase